MNHRFSLITTALLLFASGAHADEASEAKLKEQLKNALNQVRTLTTEKNTLQVAQAEMDAKNKTLDKQVKDQSKRVDELDKAMKDAKELADKALEEKVAAITRLQMELAIFKTSLDKWQAAHATIADIAKKKEAERAKLSAKASDLERKVADLRSRNAELYKVGSEILARYEKFGVGEALAAREPFTGNTKVKLQNIVQDYNDKLLDQTAKP